jgi:hypothetical protein
MLASDYLVAALATMMFNAQGKDSFQGGTCQGFLVRNRVLAGWEGQNWIKLIQDHGKYSGTPLPTDLVWGDPIRDDKFRRWLGIANNIYEGREQDIIKGTLRGCILDQCSPDFAVKVIQPTRVIPESGAIEQLHPRVAQVGRWSFFK